MKAEDALQSNDNKLRNAAIVYLHKDKGYTAEKIHNLITLSIATIKSYFYKFKHLLSWARSMFKEQVSEQYWVYIENIIMPDMTEYCKIGHTTQTPRKRASQLKWKENGKVVKPLAVNITNEILCKSKTAMQNLEDCLRIGMTAIDPDRYIPNDRLNSWQDDYPERIMSNPFVVMGMEQFAA